MRLAAALLSLALFGSAAAAAPVRVTTGAHPDFTRIVLEYDAATDWKMGRTPDGYALQVPQADLTYDLSHAFDLIDRSRLSAIWADPATGALHLSLGCQCFGIPFEFRPGTIVIDLRDGAPPKGSSFEVALDTPEPEPAPAPAPAPEPAADSAAPGTGPTYDWTEALITRTPQPGPTRARDHAPETAAAPPETPAKPVAEPAEEPAAPHESTTAAPLPGVNPGLEPLRQSLLQEMSRGASQGLIEMAVPKGQSPAPMAGPVDPSVNIRLGDAPNLVVRQKDDASAAMTAEGGSCFSDEQLNIASWADETPISLQMATAQQGLVGEFDRPDPEMVAKSVKFHLHIGFGAESRAIMAAFPDDLPDAPIWQSMARVLDGEADPTPAFAGMASCDTSAALWAVLDGQTVPSGSEMQRAAILRGFSALPPHLRRQLGAALVDRFIAMKDMVAATALHDAILRAGGSDAPEVTIMQAAMDIATGDPAAAAERLEPLADSSGPLNADALAALVQSRVDLFQEVSVTQADTLQEFLKEHQGSADEDSLRHALALARAGSGDYDAAFALLPLAPDAAAQVWTLLAHMAPDSALMAHAMQEPGMTPPLVATDAAPLITERLLGLGFAEQAALWLPLTATPDPMVAAQVALGRGDAGAALTAADGLTTPEAMALRAEALQDLGQNADAADLFATLGQDAQRWHAVAETRDWAKFAADGPEAWKSAVATLDPVAADPPPAGPLARGQILVSQSTSTRDAITALLGSVASPAAP